jgi:hypothetical protein
MHPLQRDYEKNRVAFEPHIVLDWLAELSGGRGILGQGSTKYEADFDCVSVFLRLAIGI